MPNTRIDDGFYDNPKTDRTSYAARGILMTALSYAGRQLTDGGVPDVFVKRYLQGTGGRAALRELVDLGWLHPARDLCERCTEQLRKAGSSSPNSGFYIHDYLLVNDSRQAVEKKRAKWREDRAVHRAGDRQQGFDVHRTSDVDAVEAESAPQDARFGLVRTTTENGSGLHALVDRVMAELRKCPRFVVNDLTDRQRIENALELVPDADPVTAAKEAVVWAGDPTYRNTNAISVLLSAMRKQPKKEERSDTTAAAIATGKRHKDGCPFNECDGTRWIFDEEADAARQCRCHPAYEGAAA